MNERTNEEDPGRGVQSRRVDSDSCCVAQDPSVPDWRTARLLWDSHATHGPECIVQLAAGAFLSCEE
ncbi:MULTISPECIES: hypothetical protein [unclassified Nocardia]|uniref:hypothetical protein n=1 Tax=unclassified Nocardia TaxID=2637762 RepID=UPI00278BD6A6|nr:MULTISPECIES: hypothetical protein [unclassified Nocardia]